MPPQNAVELVPTKSGTETPKNGNLNNNNTKAGALAKLDLKLTEEVPEPTKATIIIPPDGGFGWVVMFASFCCNTVVDGIVFSSGMFIEPIVSDLGASKAAVALVGSLLSGCYLLVGPFVSALTNRYGFRIVTMIGSVIAASAFALSFFAPNVIYLHFFYGVMGGVGFCFIYMPSVIIVGYYFEKWRPLATGIALCGSGVGCFIMAPISKFLIVTYGWRNALLAQAGMILLCGIFGIAYRPIEPTVVSDTKEDEQEKKSLMSEGLPSPAFTKPLPEGRFAYSVPNSSHNTWMGTPNNTTYPTAAEIFKGVTAELRRPSQTSGVLNQGNFSSTTKKLEQFKQGQKRSGHVTPTEDYSHPPILSALNAHHELGPVGEAEEVEENENGTLLDQNEAKAIIIAAAQGRRHTVSGRRPGTDSQANSRRGSRHDVSRPMYRDDIFFSGSLAKLPQYRSQTSLGYHMSVTHMPTREDIEEEEEQSSTCKMCPEAVRRTLGTMLDVSLLKDYSFILLALSGFFTMMGFFVPFIYITARAKDGGIDDDTAVFFVSAIGVFNTVARIGFGWMSSFDGVNALHLNNFFIFAGGVATMISGYFMTVSSQYIYTAVFGLACACLSALRSIIVVDLLGLDKLTNAFGIILLFQGIAAVIGSPLAGFLREVTGSYDVPFLVAGGLITFSAILTMPLKIVKNWQQQRDSKRKIAIAA